MLRRNLASEFVAGAYVFPGGSVDPEDRGDGAEELCRGLDDAEASEILGVDSGGLAFWVAALRECFEEAGRAAGPAPGRRRGTELLDTSDPAERARFEAHRLAINEGRTGLLDVCRAEDLVLAVDAVHYVSHWITPELAPRRYDTRFFVTAAPPGQVARHDDGETIATIWVRPAGRPRPVRCRGDRAAAADRREPPEAGAPLLDRAGHGLGPRRSPTSRRSCPSS